ncbi:unnamed protein product, partial [marine sediment metagenome]
HRPGPAAESGSHQAGEKKTKSKVDHYKGFLVHELGQLKIPSRESANTPGGQISRVE